MAITAGKIRRGSLGKGLKTTQVTADIPNNQLPEIVLQNTMEKTMESFVKFTAEKFEKSVWRLNVRHEGDLFDSFKYRTSSRSGAVSGAVSFNFYGRFVDMGVGKGITLMERQTGRALTNNRNPSQITRKPKTWFSPVWASQRHRFNEVLAKDIAREAGENLAGILPSGDLPITI